MPVSQAASIIGVTPRALRLRFQRGKARGFVAPDGRVHIVVSPSDRGAGPARRFRRMNYERHYDPDDIEAGPIPEPARPAPAPPTATPPDPLIERLVSSLEAQVTDMRKRLDEAERSQSELRRLLLHSQQAISDLTRRLTGLPTPRPEFDTPDPEKPTNAAKPPEPPPAEPARATAPPPPPPPVSAPPPHAEMPRPPEPPFAAQAPRAPEPIARSEAAPPRSAPPREPAPAAYPPPPPPPPFLSPSMWWMWPLMWPPPRK
jgi:hypothetical protein